MELKQKQGDDDLLHGKERIAHARPGPFQETKRKFEALRFGGEFWSLCFGQTEKRKNGPFSGTAMRDTVPDTRSRHRDSDLECACSSAGPAGLLMCKRVH